MKINDVGNTHQHDNEHLLADALETNAGGQLLVCHSAHEAGDIVHGHKDVFFLRLQEQDDSVATWSDTTITKIKQVLVRILVETEYLDDVKAAQLNPVYLHSILENAIRMNGDEAMLPAFNSFN